MILPLLTGALAAVGLALLFGGLAAALTAPTQQDRLVVAAVGAGAVCCALALLLAIWGGICEAFL